MSKPEDGASTEQADDIGEIANDDLPNNSITVHGAEVIGVKSLQSYSACVTCSVKVNVINDTHVTCSKRKTFQPLKRCQQKLSAQLYIQHGEESKFF